MSNTPLLTYDDIHQAHERIRPYIQKTSFRKAPRLSQLTNCEIYIKYENEQVSGAFKERGALNKLLCLTEDEKKAGVIAASAGNHAQGVAYHAGKLNIPSVIIMPKATPIAKIEATKEFGATVILEGDNFDSCYEAMLKIKTEKQLTLIHPFNDLDVMAGQGTIGIEINEEAPNDLEALIVAIGGGGLISGVSTALKAKRPALKIYGTQTQLYPSFYNQRQKKITENQFIKPSSTLAEGIAVKKTGDICFLTANPLLEDVILLEEKLIEEAIYLLATQTKTVAEGAGAAGLAAVLARPDLFKGKKVGFILCGGNIDARLLSSVLTRSLFHQGRLFTVKMTVNDQPGFLAEVSQIIAQEGGNIIEVTHHRHNLGMLAKDTELSFTIEARDKKHAHSLRETLIEKGFSLYS